MEVRDGEHYVRLNTEEYRLHLPEGRWEQLTRRGWRPFVIARQDRRPWSTEAWSQFGADALRPQQVPHVALPAADWKTYQFSVGDTVVCVTEDHSTVRILIQGVLPEDIVRRTVENILSNIGGLISEPCKVIEL